MVTLFYCEKQYNTIKCSYAQSTQTWVTVHYNVSEYMGYGNCYEEKAQLNTCDLSSRLKTG